MNKGEVCWAICADVILYTRMRGTWQFYAFCIYTLGLKK